MLVNIKFITLSLIFKWVLLMNIINFNIDDLLLATALRIDCGEPSSAPGEPKVATVPQPVVSGGPSSALKTLLPGKPPTPTIRRATFALHKNAVRVLTPVSSEVSPRLPGSPEITLEAFGLYSP